MIFDRKTTAYYLSIVGLCLAAGLCLTNAVIASPIDSAHKGTANNTTNTTNKATNKATKKIANEKAIVFKTMDGKTTDAFQGTLMVAENRANPNSRQIPINYVRFAATGQNPGSPIIYLSGGPGGSGISTAKYPNFRFPLFVALRQFGDVIALDQRGTGLSKVEPDCVSSQTLPMNQIISDQQVTHLHQTAAKECLASWQQKGIDIKGYTSVENARDIDALRKHLGVEKVSLWGISYGTHLALTATKQMKGHIDKMVLASAEGLNQTVKLPARTDAYFGRLQQAINQQPKAAKAYPDLIGLMHSVHQKLQHQPLKLKLPQKEGEPLDFLFGRGHMQQLVSRVIADPGRWANRLPALYLDIDQGKTDALIGIVQKMRFADNTIRFNMMAVAMDIASGLTAQRERLIHKQAKTSLLGLALNFPMPQLNKSVDGLDLGDAFRAPVLSDVPTLLLTGTLDGRTYIKSQQEATQGLSNLTQVMVINAGHNLFMSSPKVTEVIQQFLGGQIIKTKEITVDLPPFLVN